MKPHAILALALAALLAIAGGAIAGAEVIRKDNVQIVVDGGLSPQRLPRQGTAPVSVSVGGRIATTDKSPPPRLSSLSIELNRHGQIGSAGLPVCPYEAIQPASTERALNACRSALVGEGSFEAEITIGGQDPYDAKGRLLAFNGRRGGKPVLFGQIYSPRPFATSFVIVFSIEAVAKGTFGTRLHARLPATLGTWGNLTGIELKLSRRYAYRGEMRSYVSAGCPAPGRLPGANFSFARTSFGFEDGRTLRSTLVRHCSARGR